MNIKTTQITNIEFDGVEPNQYPNFEDAFIEYCEVNGIEATDKQLEWITDNLLDCYSAEIHESLI